MNRTQYVAGFMFDESYSRVALIRKKKPKWQEGLLNGIGGKIEEGEIRMEAMMREFKEETACETFASSWTYFLEMVGPDWSVSFFRSVGPLDQLRSPEEEKVEIIPVFTITPLRTDMVENLPWLIAMAIDFGMDGRPKFATVTYP